MRQAKVRDLLPRDPWARFLKSYGIVVGQTSHSVLATNEALTTIDTERGQLVFPTDLLWLALDPVEEKVRAHRLAALFQELLATLEVNRLRRVIGANNHHDAVDFEQLLSNYHRRAVELFPADYAPGNVHVGDMSKADFGEKA